MKSNLRLYGVYFFFFVCMIFSLGAVQPQGQNKKKNKNFEKMLLIINMRYSDYSTIPFIQSLYKAHFPYIIFCGEIPNENIELVENLEQGFYAHRALLHCIKKYPDYEGYLFIQDDCFLNYWTLRNFNVDSIWFDKMQIAKKLDNKEKNWPFWFWTMAGGQEQLQQIMDELPEDNKNILKENLKGSNRVGYGYGECIYIPVRLRDDFIKIGELFNKYPVYFEAALANIVLSIENSKQYQCLTHYFLPHPSVLTFCPQWGNKLTPTGTGRICCVANYKKCVNWVWPINYSERVHRVATKKWIKRS